MGTTGFSQGLSPWHGCANFSLCPCTVICLCLCPHFCLRDYVTRRVKLNPVAPFTLITSVKTPCSVTVALRFWGVGLWPVNLGGHCSCQSALLCSHLLLAAVSPAAGSHRALAGVQEVGVN